MCQNRGRLIATVLMVLLTAACTVIAWAQKEGAPFQQSVANDKPGMGSIKEGKIDPVSGAAGSLKPFEFRIEQSSTFVTDSLASLAIQVQFNALYGRVDLIPDNGSARMEPVRFFLHGQKTETVKIQPGAYTAHFAFWFPQEALASTYPLTTHLNVAKAQIAKIDFTQAHYESIRHWLIAIAKERKAQLDKKRAATEKNINLPFGAESVN